MAIGYWLVGAVATAVTVYGYGRHPHRPGAVWWLLGTVGVFALWAGLDSVRWCIRYRRSQKVPPPHDLVVDKFPPLANDDGWTIAVGCRKSA